MSTNWALRSLGRPYFSFVQDDMTYMDGQSLPSLGTRQISFDFKLNALPEMYVSSTECHALFAHVQFANGINLFEFGITPAGAMRLNIMDGAFSAYTEDGWIQADETWHSALIVYDYDLGAAYFYIDGESIGVSVSGTPARAVPEATSISQFMLFGNATGLTRCDVVLRSMEVTMDTGSGDSVVSWPINERAGASVAGSGDQAFNQNAVLTLNAQFRPPYYHANPWGDVPTDGPEDAFRWEFSTEYAEVEVGDTQYSEVGPS